MPISFQRLPVASDGKSYPTLEAAQAAEIAALLVQNRDPNETDLSLFSCATLIVKLKAAVIDILTTSENSRPTARKLHGGAKKRRAKAPEPEQPSSMEAA